MGSRRPFIGMACGPRREQRARLGRKGTARIRMIRNEFAAEAGLTLAAYSPALVDRPSLRVSLFLNIACPDGGQDQVVDDRKAFVTSANLTTAAQERSIEAGLLADDAGLAQSLRLQFETVVGAGILKPGLRGQAREF
jgi:hypothetical protein